jgi:hypothetical protein
MGRGFARWFVVVVACLGVLGTVAPDAGSVVATAPKTALVYGDSLTFESSWAIGQQFATKAGWQYAPHTYPGFAACDFLAWLPNDLATYHPRVVAIETAGNVTRPCMHDADGAQLVAGSTAYYDRYTADLDAFFSTVTATGAKVVFVTAPPMLDAAWSARITQLRVIATGLAAKYHGVSISDIPRNAVSTSGTYVTTKPCLTTELVAQGCGRPAPRRIYVRTVVGSQNGIHLCPDGLAAGYPYPCTTGYSSGEYRFGRAVANTTAAPPKPVMP